MFQPKGFEYDLYVFVNPNSKKMRLKRVKNLEFIHDQVGGYGHVRITNSPQDIPSLLRQIKHDRAQRNDQRPLLLSTFSGDGGFEQLTTACYLEDVVDATIQVNDTGTIGFINQLILDESLRDKRPVVYWNSWKNCFRDFMDSVKNGRPLDTTWLAQMKSTTHLNDGPDTQLLSVYGGGAINTFLKAYYDMGHPRKGPSPWTALKIIANGILSGASNTLSNGRFGGDYLSRFMSPRPGAITIDGKRVERDYNVILIASIPFTMDLKAMKMSPCYDFASMPKHEAKQKLEVFYGTITLEDFLYSLPSLSIGARVQTRNLIHTTAEQLIIENEEDTYVADGELPSKGFIQELEAGYGVTAVRRSYIDHPSLNGKPENGFIIEP